jgi:hypothetical protein
MDSLVRLLAAITVYLVCLLLIFIFLWAYPNALDETRSGQALGHPKSLVYIAFQRTVQDSSHIVGERQIHLE